MSIVYHESSKIFHLYNQMVSYIMMILPNGHMGQLYFGKRIHDREDFSYLLELAPRDMASYIYDNDRTFSLGHIKQEYPTYGNGDYRHPAIVVLQNDGSTYSDFVFSGYKIAAGKPKLSGLPSTYTEHEDDVQTLTIILKDAHDNLELHLLYTIFADSGIIARSAFISNSGKDSVQIKTAMSLCLDLPDHDYEWMQFSGAWARERALHVRKLEYGIQAIDSTRGHSSHEQNPFIILKRPSADEYQGEVIGCSLIYSGNFLAQAEVESHGTTRLMIGINPFGFSWMLNSGDSFQTPEALLIYSANGLNDMSQKLHRLYRSRLARGYWRDRLRPILINNWEATYFDFTEEKLLNLASSAKKCGIELFVLDDGWFGNRSSSKAGLGDWVPNHDRLPNGLEGLAEKIEKLGMKFGLWIEPEMVNADSDLFRAHPDWIYMVPGRKPCHGRYQYVLDFSRQEIVDYIFEQISSILKSANISYIKWDMNRSLTDVFSSGFPATQQGEVFHRYILGVYQLYERLTSRFPNVLFESCASGGARFDAGMLYYAPQGWISDDTDAIERLRIQYGTSYGYPIISMGSHISASPNHQIHRYTPLWTRANTAYFGTFGYELDLTKLSDDELSKLELQTDFMKKHRQLIQFGTFYRLSSPFEGNITAWMVVDENRTEALVGWFRTLNIVNGPFTRLHLHGLDENILYEVTEFTEGKPSAVSRHYGDELMNLGLITSDASSGQYTDGRRESCDFDSRLFYLKKK